MECNDLIPEGPGDTQSPEFWADVRAAEVYAARMWLFEHGLGSVRYPRARRRHFSDYTVKNCEEASGGSGPEADGVG